MKLLFVCVYLAIIVLTDARILPQMNYYKLFFPDDIDNSTGDATEDSLVAIPTQQW